LHKKKNECNYILHDSFPTSVTFRIRQAVSTLGLLGTSGNLIFAVLHHFMCKTHQFDGILL